MAQRVAVLVVLWVMTLITVVILDNLGVLEFTASGGILGIKFAAAGVAAVFVGVLVLLVYLLGKIPATRGLANGFRAMTGI